LKEAIDASLDHLQAWMAWAQKEPEDLPAKVERMRQCRGSFDLGQDFTYGIFDRDETRVLGSIGLHPRVGPDAREIGYWVHKDFVGQGLVTEAAGALTAVAFLVDRVARVEIHCDPRNVRSAAVPRRLGFVHEATLRQRLPGLDGKPRDTMIWSLFGADFPASPAAAVDLQAFDVLGRRL
jgi:RimJ/RimL family protein N-acetyltransferase